MSAPDIVKNGELHTYENKLYEVSRCDWRESRHPHARPKAASTCDCPPRCGVSICFAIKFLLMCPFHVSCILKQCLPFYQMPERKPHPNGVLDTRLVSVF